MKTPKDNIDFKEEDSTNKPDCFVIMPIANPDGYDDGHFEKVYEDIHKVACINAGYNPVRADEVKPTNLIHLDILQKLIDSPMAICDLSNRNPNVLFELGLRQAFDKPTVLVQEFGTPPIFDISPLRYTNYRKELRYREVLEDQIKITAALIATKEASTKGEGVNSIIRLLSLTKPASLNEVSDNDTTSMLRLIISQMNDLKTDLNKTNQRINSSKNNEEFNQYIGPEIEKLKRLHSYPEGAIMAIKKQLETNFKELKHLVNMNASLEATEKAYKRFTSAANALLGDVGISEFDRINISNLADEGTNIFWSYLGNKSINTE